MTRHRYAITLRTDSPLLISRTQSAGNYRQTEDIIPGRSLRGAVADILYRRNFKLFEQLFVLPEAQQIYFGPLLPVYNVEESSPPPTRFSCKHKPEHGMFDTLARQYALEVALAHDIPDWLDQLRCPICGDTAEMNSELVTSKALTTISTTHTAINRLRRTAEDTLLYTEEGTLLDSSLMVYAGWLDIPEPFIEPLSTFFFEERELRIGGSRSRGMGRVTIEGFDAFQLSEPLENRVGRFNQALQDVLLLYKDQTDIQYPELTSTEQQLFFTLNLRDEAIFLNEALPTTSPILPDGIRIVSRWIGWHSVGGWHMAARLPRRTQLSLSGVYLCRFEDLVDYEVLTWLESEGVGQLREQGFGQVIICDPIHYLNIGLGG